MSNKEGVARHSLMEMAKMVREYAAEMGDTETANAPLEDIAEIIKDEVLPEMGLKPKGGDA